MILTTQMGWVEALEAVRSTNPPSLIDPLGAERTLALTWLCNAAVLDRTYR